MGVGRMRRHPVPGQSHLDLRDAAQYAELDDSDAATPARSPTGLGTSASPLSARAARPRRPGRTRRGCVKPGAPSIRHDSMPPRSPTTTGLDCSAIGTPLASRSTEAPATCCLTNPQSPSNILKTPPPSARTKAISTSPSPPVLTSPPPTDLPVTSTPHAPPSATPTNSCAASATFVGSPALSEPAKASAPGTRNRQYAKWISASPRRATRISGSTSSAGRERHRSTNTGTSGAPTPHRPLLPVYSRSAVVLSTARSMSVWCGERAQRGSGCCPTTCWTYRALGQRRWRHLPRSSERMSKHSVAARSCSSNGTISTAAGSRGPR